MPGDERAPAPRETVLKVLIKEGVWSRNGPRPLEARIVVRDGAVERLTTGNASAFTRRGILAMRDAIAAAEAEDRHSRAVAAE